MFGFAPASYDCAMPNLISVNGTYIERASRHASEHWSQLCGDHDQEFPKIHACFPGTFNVLLNPDSLYDPPCDAAYRERAQARGRAVGRYEDGNHLSPQAKIVAINGIPVEAWIYRGGHRTIPILELISCIRLANSLGLKDGDPVSLSILEITESTADMPAPPPAEPGRAVDEA